MDAFTSSRDKSRWDWTLMIMVPNWIDRTLFQSAWERAGAKARPGRLDDVRMQTLSEGRCVQALHTGTFEDETELLAQMHDEFIARHHLTMVGKHHEIYLSDPRRAAPDKRRTILRQPVRATGG